MAVATAEDVQNRVGRPFTEDEAAQATALLEDAEARIMVRVPYAVARSGTDEVFKANLVAVECAVVIRAGRFGEDVASVYGHEESASVNANPDATAGYLSVRSREWRALGIGNPRILAVTPAPPKPWWCTDD